MLFGKFNPLIDELVHWLIALPLPAIFYLLDKISLSQFGLTIIFSSLLIDFDHLLNPIIARILKLESGVSYGRDGYTIKILHGFDSFFVMAVIIGLITNNFYLASIFFINLCIHEFWDFLVYPHSSKELLLLTRALSGFHPGKRNYLLGIFFKVNTLKY